LDGELEVRLPWSHELTQRAEIAQQLFSMVDQAMAAFETE
jgi:3-methyladenine DNA glycosylase AlkC